jgi:hypothetical protein
VRSSIIFANERWGNSVLGFIAIMLVPIPFLLYRYGEWLRTAYPVKLE